MFLSVIGLRVLKVVRDITEGHNMDFVQIPKEVEDHEILLRGEDGAIWCLHLWNSSGICGSGWTTASWGHAEIKRVADRGPVTHDPICEILVEIDEKLPEDFHCEAFGWSWDGGDGYYPRGSVFVKMEKFQPTGRGHEKPVVWVFTGPSNLGKSTLGQALKGLTVYETDQAPELLPKIVHAQVVVVGGRHKYTVQDIQYAFAERGLDVEIVEVSFSSR